MNIDVYVHYKPLRNFIRQLPTVESLDVIYHYIQWLQSGKAPPSYIEVLPQHRASERSNIPIFEWELESLAREILINGSATGTKSLQRWDTFCKAINLIKNFDNDISKVFASLHQDKIFLYLNRLAYRQFYWQHTDSITTLLRYMKLLNTPELRQCLENATGIRLQELYFITVALGGGFLKESIYLKGNFQNFDSVRPESALKFLVLFSRDLASLQKEAAAAQVFDEFYFYTFNPLVACPLIALNLNGQDFLMAPIVRYVLNIVINGIYYKLVDQPGFEYFGPSYQNYIGEVMEVCNLRKSYIVLPERKYALKKGDEEDSVDWIAEDDTGSIFLECKTKRLRHDARMDIAEIANLEKEYRKLAAMVVQVYKTLNDALQGHYPHWEKKNTPIYPVVVTLEDWMLFAPDVHKMLNDEIARLFALENLNPAMLEDFPYTICWTEEWEMAMQVISQLDIRTVMSEKVEPGNRQTIFRGFLIDKFEEQVRKCRRHIFPGLEKEIHPSVASLPDEL